MAATFQRTSFFRRSSRDAARTRTGRLGGQRLVHDALMNRLPSASLGVQMFSPSRSPLGDDVFSLLLALAAEHVHTAGLAGTMHRWRGEFLGRVGHVDAEEQRADDPFLRRDSLGRHVQESTTLARPTVSPRTAWPRPGWACPLSAAGMQVPMARLPSGLRTVVATQHVAGSSYAGRWCSRSAWRRPDRDRRADFPSNSARAILRPPASWAVRPVDRLADLVLCFPSHHVLRTRRCRPFP